MPTNAAATMPTDCRAMVATAIRLRWAFGVISDT